MTLTDSVATNQCLLSIHYSPGTVIATLFKLTLLLIMNLQGSFTYYSSEEMRAQ